MRKFIASTLAVGVVGVPTAFGAGANDDPGKAPARLVSPTTLDKQWKHAKQVLRQRRQAAQRRQADSRVSVSSELQQIAQCESHRDPHAVGGGGTYRGKYQFDMATWASVGGRGDPAAAPEAEQDERAAILYARSGPSQWPVCGG